MKYELTPQSYRLLRKLMWDLQLLLNEFGSHPELGGLGYVSATARRHEVEELIVRCQNMVSLPHFVDTPVTVPDEWRAAPTTPLPSLSEENLARAREAEARYVHFTQPAPTSDESSDIDEAKTKLARIQQYRYDRGFKDAVAGEPPTEASAEYRQGYDAGKLALHGMTRPTPTSHDSSDIHEIKINPDDYEQCEDPDTGAYFFRKKTK